MEHAPSTDIPTLKFTIASLSETSQFLTGVTLIALATICKTSSLRKPNPKLTPKPTQKFATQPIPSTPSSSSASDQSEISVSESLSNSDELAFLLFLVQSIGWPNYTYAMN